MWSSPGHTGDNCWCSTPRRFRGNQRCWSSRGNNWGTFTSARKRFWGNWRSWILRLGGKIRSTMNWWAFCTFSWAQFTQSIWSSSWGRWWPFELWTQFFLCWLDIRWFSLKHLNEMRNSQFLVLLSTSSHHSRIVREGLCNGGWA